MNRGIVDEVSYVLTIGIVDEEGRWWMKPRNFEYWDSR